jgi:hypothetical protein
MVKLNINEEKVIDFEFELSGLSPRQIDTMLRFRVDNVEYGFPAELKEDRIRIEIPPLKNIVKREFKEGETFDARLEVTGDGHYLVPWNDHLKIYNPIKMEAKLNENEEDVNDKPELKVKVREAKPEPKKNISEKKKITKEPDFDKLVEEKVSKTKKKMIKETSGGTVTKSKSKTMTKEQFMNITKEQVMEYIEKKGSKNPQIRELIYNQAVQAAGSAKPYKVFAKVYEVFKNKKK